MTTPMTTASDAMSRPGLVELVDRIRQCTRRESDPRATARLVAEILTELRPGAHLLTAAEREGSADGYIRHTLHTEASFSISAVVWRPGQITEIHDHLVWCSFLVLQGTETENVFDIDGDRLVQIGRRQRPAGSVSGVAPPDDIHQVHNTGETVAVTLHVYGADLSQETSVRRVYQLHTTPQASTGAKVDFGAEATRKPATLPRMTIMDLKEIEQELADAHELLSQASMARLAYNGLDGRPRVIPIGIFWTGTEIVMATAATAPKVKALTARPEVALTIDVGDSPGTAKTLSVRGVVDLTIVDGVVPEYLAAARKNYDAEYAAEFERNCRALYDQMARIALKPQWARFYDFSVGRMPQFLSELAQKLS